MEGGEPKWSNLPSLVKAKARGYFQYFLLTPHKPHQTTSEKKHGDGLGDGIRQRHF